MADSNPLTGDILPTDPSWIYGSVLPLARNPSTGEMSLAIPSMLRSPINDLWAGVRASHDALAGPGLTESEARDAAMRTASGMLGLNLLGSPSAALTAAPDLASMFVSPKALGEGRAANYDLIKPFWQGEAQQLSPDELYAKSGLFRGAEGRLRAEIDDSKASLTPAMPSSVSPIFNREQAYPHQLPREGVPLDSILDHPDLFHAYPELRNVTVKGPDFGMMVSLGGIKGSYETATNTIRLNNGDPSDVLSTLMHEVQHRIQDIEGWGQGGNPQMFLPKNFNEEFAKVQLPLKETEGKLRSAGVNVSALEDTLTNLKRDEIVPLQGYELENYKKAESSGLLEEYAARHDAWAPMENQRADALASYYNLAGEIEARSVQERLEHGIAPGELAPWQMPGYPANQTLHMPNALTTTPVHMPSAQPIGNPEALPVTTSMPSAAMTVPAKFPGLEELESEMLRRGIDVGKIARVDNALASGAPWVAREGPRMDEWNRVHEEYPDLMKVWKGLRAQYRGAR